MSFEDGTSASMTMTAFTAHGGRKTRIFGTLGEIDTDSQLIHIHTFLDDTTQTIDTNTVNDGGINSGHGGGDYGIMEAFLEAVSSADKSTIVSGWEASLASHLMVFAAEESRKNNTVVFM